MADPDPALIGGLRAAVEADPGNHALRTHLAELLVAAGEAAEAIDHAAAVLADVPDDRAALAQAAAAADALGETDRAAGYRRILAGLSSGREPPTSETRERVVRLHSVRATGTADDDESERPAVTLDDVGGMEQVKRRLRAAFLAPLENPALRRMYGKSLRGGLLLYGPPGCGKTFIARATAGELGARFVGIGLHDVLDMWLGESEKRLHELFENARRNAPCVLFFDEVDALGRKRSQLRHSGGREVVVQFLSELDSFGQENEGVFVLAATNHPWDVDTALRRPGRLDRMLLVLPPDPDARQAILEFHLRDRPVGDLDLHPIVAATELYSGADLAHICETAAEYALEDSLESGTPRPIETPDLHRALAEIPASTIPWLKTARNYAEFAGEGGTYDELLDYLRSARLM
jgi:SpoVK/Ycf46/Vps4 family AAA+-type ATPase